MMKWFAAVCLILAITAAIPIILNSDGPPPSDRQPAQTQARSEQDLTGSRRCAELSRVAQVWKMEMTRLEGSRSGSPRSVMDLTDSDSDATIERLRSVYEILVAKREECKKLLPRKAAGGTGSADQSALADRRDRLVTALAGAVDALDKALDGVEAMSIPRADRSETVRLWDQALAVERAVAGAVESIGQWTVDQILPDQGSVFTGHDSAPAPLAAILQDREFSEKLSKALFGKKTNTLDELVRTLDEICVVLGQSAEAIFVEACGSRERRLDALTILLDEVHRFESHAVFLTHAFGNYRRARTRNFHDVGLALADFLLSKAIVAQHLDLWQPEAAKSDHEFSTAHVEDALDQISKLEGDLDRLATLRRRLEAIGTRLRCRFTRSQSLHPPRLAIGVHLDRAIQTAQWLERIAGSYSIYDASQINKE